MYMTGGYWYTMVLWFNPCRPISRRLRSPTAGFQVAAGVPWMLDTQPAMATFRIGLFGLDKVKDPTGTVAVLENGVKEALEGVDR